MGELVFLELCSVSLDVCISMFDSRAYHFLLDQRLKRIDLAVVSALNKLDLSKGTLTNDFQRREVVWLFLRSQESQVLNLSVSHAVLLLGFAIIGDRRFLHDRLEFQCSVLISVSCMVIEMDDHTSGFGRVLAERCL